MPKLIFTRWTGRDGVFFEAETYRKLQKINKAMNDAKTWGEFRTMLPKGEFEELPNWISNGGEELFWDGDNYLFGDSVDHADIDEFYIARYSDAFTYSSIYGVDEGDYPTQMDAKWEDFPDGFPETYGKSVSSFVSGSWWEFPMEKFEQMQDYLSQHGYSVKKID
jgi:hypothetical protein